MDNDGPSAPVDEGEGAVASSLIHPTDLRLALFILAVCAYLYWVTTEFEQVADIFAQDVGPEFFPRLLLWTIVLLSLALPFEHLFLKEKRKGLDKNRKSRIEPMTFVTAGMLIATVASIPWLGSVLSIVAICILLPLLWGGGGPRFWSPSPSYSRLASPCSSPTCWGCISNPAYLRSPSNRRTAWNRSSRALR